MGQTVEPVNVNPTPKRNRSVASAELAGYKVAKGKGRGKRTKSMKLGTGATSGIMTPPTTTRNGIGR